MLRETLEAINLPKQVYLFGGTTIFDRPDGMGQSGQIPDGGVVLAQYQGESPKTKRKRQLVPISVLAVSATGDGIEHYISPGLAYLNGGLSVGPFVVTEHDTFYVDSRVFVGMKDDDNRFKNPPWWVD